ncbi:MAG: alkaline phosphatase [Candidatus Latescibacteria bacterium]|nr:alkaline phosphatase [Candidatus Latescibacterota bacterium]MBT4138395.1 alkaline phosphatase [Candidatus Latescibacterota bacterium]
MHTGNKTTEIQGNKWVVTRRDVLRASGLLVAGLSLGTPLAYGAESKPKKMMHFGMVTDMHYADADTRGVRHYRESLPKLEECITFMNEQKVSFLIELGDLKDQGPDAKEADTLTYLETIEAAFSKFEGPRYHVLGNHDMDSISKEQFLARAENTGINKEASYYSFDQAGLHFVVLDACYTTDGADYDHGNFSWKDPNIPQKQCDWLKEDLASTSKPTLVFVHQLLDGETSHCVKNAAQVRQILQDSQKVLAAFHGHNHVGQYSHIEGIHYYTLKAVVEGSGEENNSYATVDIYDDNSVIITGYRKAVSKNMASD